MPTRIAPVVPPDAGAVGNTPFPDADGGWVRRLTPFWPSVAVSALFMALMGILVHRSMAVNDGHFIYPMDDAYGHMAIAKNLFQHGVWGFSPKNGFSSGGSSLLWPLLLAACFAVFGVHEWVPLALNIVAVVGFLFYAGSLIRRYTLSSAWALLLLLAVMYLTPLPTVAACGMEHSWQILISLVFLDVAAAELSGHLPAEDVRRMSLRLPLLAVGMAMARYEGLFLVAVVSTLLFYRRRRRLAMLCGAGGLLPVAVFGVYSMAKGWHFLPNSLLLKADISPLASLDSFFTKGYHAALYNPHLFVLVLGLAGALLVRWRRDSRWNRLTILLSTLLTGTLIHLQFADVAWFYRYEAYLMAIGILILGVTLIDEVHAVRADGQPGAARTWHLFLVGVAAVGLCGPLWARAANAWNETPLASHNIYEQQYQMARLVRQSYRDQGVAANDIGALDFFANVGLVDLWGLGTAAVADARRAGTYDQALVQKLITRANVRLIMIDPAMANLYGGPPAEWIPAGRWTIPDNFVCGNATVCFYAPDAPSLPKLVDALQTFAPHLPPGVAQAGFYCGELLPHVQGTYPAEVDGGGIFYWSGRTAQFTLVPSDARPDAADVDATLDLTARVVVKDVVLDVLLDGRRVASHRYPAAEVGQWVEISIPVHWREGLNVLTIQARGGHFNPPAGDDRALLFAVHEPKWTFAEPYEPEPPSDDPPEP